MRALDDACTGVLIGTAVGDSLGLPAEGLSRARIAARWRGEWRQRLLFGYGLVSDDTEHAALVARSLASHRHDTDPFGFQRALLRYLRLWFVCLPPGVGLATARACIKMWLGFGCKSGVHSAGNGPAMRAAIIGAFFADDPARRRAFVTASTELTHTDPKANWAALAIAECAALERQGAPSPAAFRERLERVSEASQWRELVAKAFVSLDAGQSVDEYAAAIGQGSAVTGYALHSVPVALFAWLRHRPNVELALTSSLNCGGDTDSVGAIVAGVAGAALGADGFPRAWVEPIRDWPFGIGALKKTGAWLGGVAPGAPPILWPLLLLRNLLVLVIVLAHGFRRLLPPYAPTTK